MTLRELIAKLEWQFHQSLLDGEEIAAIQTHGVHNVLSIEITLASGHYCRIDQETPTLADPVTPNSRGGWNLVYGYDAKLD